MTGTPTGDRLGSGPDITAARSRRPDGDAAEVEDLRRRLRIERERSMNATDRVLGAQAEAAQARAEIKELYHRLHVREAEVTELRAMLGGDGGPPASAGPVDGLARLGRRGRTFLAAASSAARRILRRS